MCHRGEAQCRARLCVRLPPQQQWRCKARASRAREQSTEERCRCDERSFFWLRAAGDGVRSFAGHVPCALHVCSCCWTRGDAAATATTFVGVVSVWEFGAYFTSSPLWPPSWPGGCPGPAGSPPSRQELRAKRATGASRQHSGVNDASRTQAASMGTHLRKLALRGTGAPPGNAQCEAAQSAHVHTCMRLGTAHTATHGARTFSPCPPRM